MSLIDDFINQYKKEYDFYSELARISCQMLEAELEKRGIKCIVSFRAKNPSRLYEKIEQRKDKKKYKSIADIYSDIIDLAGVRVALYFPSEREIVDEVVKEIFEVKQKKQFPVQSHKPKYEKRFSGYWATHYRSTIKDNDKNNERYKDTIFEIQVASVLMHAWAEVEHDLVYKPLSGDLSDEELSIIDEINGLVIAGEIALERLQKSMARRVEESNEINDKYQLTNLILNNLNKNYINKLKLGDTKLLTNYLKNIHKYDPQTFSKYLINVNQSVDETISEQVLNMLLRDYFKDSVKEKSLSNYFQALNSVNDTSGFEAFVKTWIVLEKAVTIINKENNRHHRKYFVPNFELLANMDGISKKDINQLHHFRKIRNQLLHGIETPADEYLNEAFETLKEICLKIINLLENEDQRNKLIEELNSI